KRMAAPAKAATGRGSPTGAVSHERPDQKPRHEGIEHGGAGLDIEKLIEEGEKRREDGRALAPEEHQGEDMDSRDGPGPEGGAGPTPAERPILVEGDSCGDQVLADGGVLPVPVRVPEDELLGGRDEVVLV